MDDRELTEAAARAADIEHEGWQPPSQGHGVHYGLWIGHRLWSPLNNDGDAMRLANRLRFSVHRFRHCVSASGYGGLELDEAGSDDASTRRAIVRAAAAMTGNADPTKET